MLILTMSVALIVMAARRAAATGYCSVGSPTTVGPDRGFGGPVTLLGLPGRLGAAVGATDRRPLFNL